MSPRRGVCRGCPNRQAIVDDRLALGDIPQGQLVAQRYGISEVDVLGLCTFQIFDRDRPGGQVPRADSHSVTVGVGEKVRRLV
ncbi:hypothetical protein [Rhodococcus jostii]|uniref:hypothetical protein n=1 Tax=Rhodococcus jostii TaxID=132919 RepID=UPI00142F39D0|nr:hypothetical protein [Rhodococcus jostii]